MNKWRGERGGTIAALPSDCRVGRALGIAINAPLLYSPLGMQLSFIPLHWLPFSCFVLFKKKI